MFDILIFLLLDVEFCRVWNVCLVCERLMFWWGNFFWCYLSFKIFYFIVLKFCKFVDIESYEYIWSDNYGNCINVL